MKHNGGKYLIVPILLILALCFICVSCRNTKKKTLPYTELSFMQFTLGKSFHDGLALAKENPEVKELIFDVDGDVETITFDTRIPDYNEPNRTIRTHISVSCFRELVYSIIVKSFYTEGGAGLRDLYFAKYGSIEEEPYTWEFENAVINYRSVLHGEWKWNNYFSGNSEYVVTYTDKVISNDAKQYIQRKEFIKDSLKQAERQRVQDSLSVVKKAYEDEQNRKRQGIVDNFSY